MSSPSPEVSAQQPADATATKLIAGRYEVIRELGHGGMGVVHLAYDKTFCRNVALKQTKVRRDGHLERFRREYRALAAVRHTGVPAIYDSGDDHGPFFTMEIITGPTIADLVKRGPLPPARALALAIELGRVLMAVHAAGVIHRDVKPANVIVEPGDRVRLIDFGACLLTDEYYKAPHLRDVTAEGERWHTSEHEFIGSIAYVCPQYWTEGLVAPQTDVFSVCVVLYEMLTGRALYGEAGGFRKITAAEFPSRLAPLVAELEIGLAGAEDRHETMADLVRALEIVRSKLAAPRRIGVMAVASVASFVLGAVLATAVPSERLSEVAATNDAGNPTERSSEIAAAVPSEFVAAVPSEVAAAVLSERSSEVAAVVPNGRSSEVAAATSATDESSSEVAAASDVAGKRSSEVAAASVTRPSPPTAASPKPKKPPPSTWDERLSKADTHARRCLEKAGLKVSPRLTTIPAGEPARVRGVASDSREASCIREALDRFGVRVAEGQRQHTFFAE
ncbi:serine/threonine-protein kinase [Nannocystis pusilla]|uniref:Protein kinase n=1 Tax=Nannocystis pusilla TaxID=889268 RepID=A0ABS7TMG4_9BACT|nr:serine/threonine-protein kinase [Nannocystis pusilla]MBZ5709417.1 protein kinase [Nannocystis pusilla]